MRVTRVSGIGPTTPIIPVNWQDVTPVAPYVSIVDVTAKGVVYSVFGGKQAKEAKHREDKPTLTDEQMQEVLQAVGRKPGFYLIKDDGTVYQTRPRTT